MTDQGRGGGVLAVLRREMRDLVRVEPSDRPWQMPFAAALAVGGPMFVGAWFGRLDFGLVSSLGGLTFLYLPRTPLSHRMVVLMAAAFGMTASFTLGVMSHFVPLLMMPVLTFTAVLVTMVCRFYRVGAPGPLFFIMSASIGAYTPARVADLPVKVGLFALGCLLACVIAFLYSVHILRRRMPLPVPSLPPPTFDQTVFDPVVIGGFVGLSLAVAQVLALPRAYWVPVSCLAVIQGLSLRAVWTRQIHRVAGTALGLGLAWLLLKLPPDPWLAAATILALAFIIESLVVRHYAAAVLFITPMTILLADAASLGHVPADAIMRARLLDTVVGSAVGALGGVCLHSTRFRATLAPWLRRLAPGRRQMD